MRSGEVEPYSEDQAQALLHQARLRAVGVQAEPTGWQRLRHPERYHAPVRPVWDPALPEAYNVERWRSYETAAADEGRRQAAVLRYGRFHRFGRWMDKIGCLIVEAADVASVIPDRAPPGRSLARRDG